MRFKLGAAIGFAAGYLAAAKAGDERRRQVDDAIHRVTENPRVRHVSEVLSRDAKRIGDAVEERLAKTADTVVESVAGTVEPEPSGGEVSRPRGAQTTKHAPKSGAAR
jgi:gas vesicle protein